MSADELADDLCNFVACKPVDHVHDVLVVASVREIVPEHAVERVFTPALRTVLERTNLSQEQVQLITNLTCPNANSVGEIMYPYHDTMEFYCGVTHYLSMIADTKGYNSSWNPNSNSALFLMGKPYKESRLCMFYMLAQRPVFRDLVYSFYGCLNSDTLIQRCEELLAEIDPREDYRSFAEQHQRVLDIPTDQSLYSRDAYHYSGFPTDVSLYSETAFSIVAETDLGHANSDNTSWITEKIWRAIANHHPFLLIDFGSMHRYLNSLGIKTFERFYCHSLTTIAGSNSLKQMLSYYADNVQYFMDVKHRHIDEINHIVEYNFEKYIEIAQRDFQVALKGNNDFRDLFFQITAHGNLEQGFTI